MDCFAAIHTKARQEFRGGGRTSDLKHQTFPELQTIPIHVLINHSIELPSAHPYETSAFELCKLEDS